MTEPHPLPASRGVSDPAETSPVASLDANTFDPWDERPVTIPAGLLAVLVESTEKADDKGLLGPGCPADPCPYCTALQEANGLLYDLGIDVIGYDMTGVPNGH